MDGGEEDDNEAGAGALAAADGGDGLDQSPAKSAEARSAVLAANATLSPSVLTSIRAGDINKRVKVVASLIPKRLRHSDKEDLLSFFSFETELAKLLVCDSAEAMLEIQEILTKGKKDIIAFTDAMKASARSLKGSVANFKRHHDGTHARAEAAALAQEQSLQAAAAQSAKAELEKRAKEIPPTWKHCSKFPAVATTNDGFASAWYPSVPCFFAAAGVAKLEELKKDPAVQLMFASFGGSYKRTNSFTQSKLYSAPVEAKKGLEQINTWVAEIPMAVGRSQCIF